MENVVTFGVSFYENIKSLTTFEILSSTNVSLVFSNTSRQSRRTMHDYLSKTDQPATFDKLQSKLITLYRRMQEPYYNEDGALLSNS